MDRSLYSLNEDYQWNERIEEIGKDVVDAIIEKVNIEKQKEKEHTKDVDKRQS